MYTSPALVRALYASTALIALSSAAGAADITYVGPVGGGGGGSGNWGTPSLWSPNSVPTAADTAIIKPGTVSIAVTSQSVAEVGKIYFESGAKLNGNGIGLAGASGIVKIYGIDGIGIHYASSEDSTGPRNAQIMNDLEYLIDNPDGGKLSTGPGAGISLGSKTLTVNVVNAGNTFNVGAPIKGSGNIILRGNGLLTTNGVHTFTGYTDIQSGTLRLTGNGTLSSSSSINVDGTFDTSSVTPATTSIQALTGATTGSVVLGAKTLNLTNARGAFSGVISGSGGLTVASGTQLLSGNNSYSGLTTIANGATLRLGAGGTSGSVAGNILADGALLFDRSDKLDLAGAISGTGTMEQAGLGTTVLTGANTYSGATTISGGTLRAGGAATLSSASAYTVSAGGTLDLDGFGHTIASLANGGNVRLSGNADTTLTVTGNYTGNGGTLYVSSVLGTNNSPTDLLHVEGSTSGITHVVVANVGGAGAKTTGDGIKIVEVDGVSAAGAFVLNGPTIAGAYRYDLFQNGLSGGAAADGNWYLRADGLAPTLPTYESYPEVLLGLIALPTLQQRVGDRRPGSYDKTGGNGLWTRIEGSTGRVKADSSTTGASYDSDLFELQVGVDGQMLENTQGALIAGLTAQYSRASAEVSSNLGNGSNTTEGYGIGATLTWYGANGVYVDGQGQFAWFNSDLSADGVGKLADGNNGAGYALSVELGKELAIAPGWTVTPQAQLSYASVDFDDLTDPFGAEVSLRHGESLKGRAGATLGRDANWQDDEGRKSRTHVYAVTSLTYEFLDGATVAVSGVDLVAEPQKFGAELGLGGTYNWADERFALHGEAVASTSFDGSYDYKGTVGMTVGF